MKPEDYINQLLLETDFSKIMQIRTKFRQDFPKDFEKYMNEFATTDKQPWESFCVTCKNWENNRCTKNLKPLPLRKRSDKQEYFCSEWDLRK